MAANALLRSDTATAAPFTSTSAGYALQLPRGRTTHSPDFPSSRRHPRRPRNPFGFVRVVLVMRHVRPISSPSLRRARSGPHQPRRVASQRLGASTTLSPGTGVEAPAQENAARPPAALSVVAKPRVATRTKHRQVLLHPIRLDDAPPASLSKEPSRRPTEPPGRCLRPPELSHSTARPRPHLRVQPLGIGRAAERDRSGV
jgi:hypothetical protein